MNAKKCDRCGKLYEAVWGLELHVPNTPHVRCDSVFDDMLSNCRVPHYSIFKEEIPDAYSHKLDLCEDCQKSLINWIENGKGKEKK